MKGTIKDETILEQLKLFNVDENPKKDPREVERRKMNRLKAIEVRRNRAERPIDMTKPWKRQFIQILTKPVVKGGNSIIIGDSIRAYEGKSTRRKQ